MIDNCLFNKTNVKQKRNLSNNYKKETNTSCYSQRLCAFAVKTIKIHHFVEPFLIFSV